MGQEGGICLTPLTPRVGGRRESREERGVQKKTKERGQKDKKLTAPALPMWSPTIVLCWPYVA